MPDIRYPKPIKSIGAVKTVDVRRRAIMLKQSANTATLSNPYVMEVDEFPMLKPNENGALWYLLVSQRAL